MSRNMASISLPILALWIYMKVLLKADQVSGCGVVNTSASVVAVGSSISASCHINNDCPLTKGKQFRVEWKINNQLVPSNLTSQESNGTYAVLIPHILGRINCLTCRVCVETNCQIVDGSFIKVEHPPSIPKNLSCAMTFSPSGMLCQWDPGQETTNDSTTYTLHTKTSDSTRTTSKSYVLAPGVHSYQIPRVDIQLIFEIEIYVEVANIFWNISSEHLRLVPIETAMYGPPEIQSIEAYNFGCFKYRWSLPESQSWVKMTCTVELSLKEVDNKLGKELTIQRRASYLCGSVKVCSLLHWTNYSTKIRVRYFNIWSEWSDLKVATTLTKAPSGHLDTWLKVPDDGEVAQLYWKPSQKFHANGWITSYTVESKEPKQTLCVTRENHCSFKLRKWIRKVYVTACNANGSSSPTEVKVYQKKGLEPVSNISVHPQSQSSMYIVWERSVSSHVVGYVLEWRSLSETPEDKLFFTLLDKNQTSTVITGFEPYKPYDISIYPKYMEGIGRSLTVTAYSSEKAPSVTPELMLGDIHSSFVHLLWDEIPLEQRNGIIRGYTIYFWDERHNLQILWTQKTDMLVRHLQPLSRYNALISVHTHGGSVNGSAVTFKTPQLGGFEMVLLVIPVCVGFSLLILITVFTCLNKHKRLKMCLWPIIPDPANSSIRRWTTTDSLQGMPPFKEDKDPVMVYLSHFSILDLSDNEPCNSDYVKDNIWSREGDSHEEHRHNLFPTSQQDTDSVPYATVLFSPPYQNQTASPPVYLRSESTQPLLGVEDPGSPPPYENMAEDVSVAYFFMEIPQASTGNEALWEEFPMLRSLQNNNTDQI